MPHQGADDSASRHVPADVSDDHADACWAIFPVGAAPVGFFTDARRFGYGMPDRERTYCGTGVSRWQDEPCTPKRFAAKWFRPQGNFWDCRISLKKSKSVEAWLAERTGDRMRLMARVVARVKGADLGFRSLSIFQFRSRKC